jgi:hypothetical protein
MVSVRNIIVEALSRATLANRKQGAQPSLVEDAYIRFCGILREYSDNNFITAYRGEVEFDGSTEQIEINGPDITADGITDIKAAYYRADNSPDYYPLNFVSLETFYDCSLSDYTYSYQPIGENKFKLYLKPRFAQLHKRVKLIYNIEIKLGIDDAVNLPIVYTELLTRALALKMAIDKPRATPDKRNELRAELETLENQLKANNADNRILTRTPRDRFFNIETLKSGSFIFGS